MKKLSYFIVLAMAAYALQACHSNSSPSAADSAATADSGKNKAAADSAKVDSGDVKFAKTLAEGGSAEISFSKLAEQKVAAGKLKDFAAMMITDHTNAADSLSAIAQKENITLSSTMDADHQNKFEDMQKMTADDFKKAYVNLMVADHTGAVSLLMDESKNGKDPALKAFAAKILPTVQGHLDAINKIKAGIK
ncbi:MAG TPA: DUF4142 domain-containing protein [Mucilaginibacter sp.]|jgi:putative membrane protein|nr:DUF4142 domain-containing protein [Mucilaginibacter sp.]